MQKTHRWHSETLADMLPPVSQVSELLVVELIDFTGSQEMACIVLSTLKLQYKEYCHN